MRWRLPFLFAATSLAVGCSPEIVPEPYRPSSARDAYRHSLERSGLLHTALGQEWLAAGRHALEAPIPVEPSFREALYVDARAAFAVGYRLSLLRGQRSEVRVRVEGVPPPRLFVDLFRLSDEPDAEPVHVASAGEGDRRLAFEPRRDGEYLLRLQSELLRGGRVRLEIRNVASLGFPVEGHDTGAIGSRFGAPREGGRRQHHGVDIFADRHTPVRAPARAWVRRVADWRLGGRVIWLHDRRRDLHLYFAHLESRAVREGTWVDAGETIGSVGNSGNARTTPPHLHFGIYVRGEGPIDPWPFLHEPAGEPPEVGAGLDALGTWRRTGARTTRLRAALGRRSPSVGELPPHTAVRVLGAARRSLRVRLPDGVAGYVGEADLEPLGVPLATAALETDDAGLLDAPSRDALTIAALPAGSTLEVLARFGGFAMVPAPGGGPAWVHEETARPLSGPAGSP